MALPRAASPSSWEFGYHPADLLPMFRLLTAPIGDRMSVVISYSDRSWR